MRIGHDLEFHIFVDLFLEPMACLVLVVSDLVSAVVAAVLHPMLVAESVDCVCQLQLELVVVLSVVFALVAYPKEKLTVSVQIRPFVATVLIMMLQVVIVVGYHLASFDRQPAADSMPLPLWAVFSSHL